MCVRPAPAYRKHKSGQARVTIAGKTFYLGKHGTPASREAYDRLVAEWRQAQLAAEAPPGDPKYVRHSSGQARVVIDGKTHYLGRHGSRESRAAYHRLIAEWRGNGCALPAGDDRLTVNDLVLAYWKHAQDYYRRADGTPVDGTLATLKMVLRHFRRLYGTTPAADFGPLALKAVRQGWIDRRLARKTIRNYVNAIKALFKWAAGNELVPPAVNEGLRAVEGLRAGRSKAREPERVRPVSVFLLRSAQACMSPQLLAMTELQRLTGMRPGEVCIMRGCDLETSGRVWIFRPHQHKTKHRGHVREVYIGPRAQTVLEPFLKTELQAYLFSPAEAEVARQADRRGRRQTPLYPSHLHRLASKRKRCRGRPPGERYTKDSYHGAVAEACARAFPLPAHLAPAVLPNGRREATAAWRARLTQSEKETIRAWRRNHQWNPNQLRHNAATELRKQHGIELSRIVLGHAEAFTTEIYAEADRQQAIDVMAKIG